MRKPTIIPAEFEGQNVVYRGNGDSVKDLPTCVATNADPELPEGGKYVISKWKLSPEDVQRVLETGEIWLCTMGTGVTPTLVLSENPLTEHGFEPVQISNDLPDDEDEEDDEQNFLMN